jgi:hypothetical protein
MREIILRIFDSLKVRYDYYIISLDHKENKNNTLISTGESVISRKAICDSRSTLKILNNKICDIKPQISRCLNCGATKHKLKCDYCGT